jgi:hypothetical protein
MTNYLFSHAIHHHFHVAAVASILVCGLLILFKIKSSKSFQ